MWPETLVSSLLATYENSGAMGIHSTHRTVLVNLTQGQNAWISGLGSQSYGNIYQIADQRVAIGNKLLYKRRVNTM